MKSLVFKISIAVLAQLPLYTFSQVAITPRQTVLIAPTNTAKMVVTAPAQSVQIAPQERYKIVSAARINGKWDLRIFDAQLKKTYSMLEGVTNTAAEITVEKFDSKTLEAEISSPFGKLTIGMKLPSNVEAKRLQDEKLKAARAAVNVSQPEEKKDEVSFERTQARAATKANVSSPKKADSQKK